LKEREEYKNISQGQMPVAVAAAALEKESTFLFSAFKSIISKYDLHYGSTIYAFKPLKASAFERKQLLCTFISIVCFYSVFPSFPDLSVVAVAEAATAERMLRST